MKVAVTSSSRFNLYASSLIARLRQRGVRVEAVICTERSRATQLRDYARRHGWAAAFREMAGRGDDTVLDPDAPSLSIWDEGEWEW